MSDAVADVAATETATEDGSSLNLSGLSALMAANGEEKPEPAATPEDQTEESPEVEAIEAAPEEEPEIDEGEGSIEAQYNLSDMPDEDRRALMKEWGTGADSRIGRLTAKAKAAEERARELEAELGKREPLRQVENNPLEGKTLEELEKVYDEAIQTIERGEDVLDEHEDSLASEEVWNLEGTALTKSQVRKMVRNARKYIDTYIPAQQRELKRTASYEDGFKASRPIVEQMHPWMKEDGNALRAQYEAIAPEWIEKVRKHIPEMLPSAELILADHAEACDRRARAETEPETPKKKTPVRERRIPGNPGGSGGAPSRPSVSQRKRKDAAEKQFMESRGSQGDIAALFLSNH